MPRVRLDPKADQDILDWLNEFGYGAKSRAIKEALRRGIGIGQAPDAIAPASQSADLVAPLELLAQMRCVFDASLESALSGLQLGKEAREDAPQEEVENILDDFAGLMMLD